MEPGGSSVGVSHQMSHMIAKEEPIDAVELTKQLKQLTSPTVNAQDYDDPQAGPSGIKQESHRNDYRQTRCYTNIATSSDDDSDDDHEIMQTTTLWRSRGTFNLNQTSRPSLNNHDMDEDSLHNRTTSGATGAVAAPGSSAGGSGNGEKCTSGTRNTKQPGEVRGSGDTRNFSPRLRVSPRGCGVSTSEILTAPDLQLDWLSDSSDQSIDEVVCVPLPSSSPAVDVANVKAETGAAAATNEPSLQIDLTTSDDEDVMEINVNVFNGGADTRSPRLPSSPVRVPPLTLENLQQALYDEYHNREPSHVGLLNCRSAYSTCDCLEASR